MFVTAPSIAGPWSEPVYLNGVGFDQSFFHDEDGRTYLVGMKWDHRPGHNPFYGVFLQEYSRGEQRLVGSPRHIFGGSSLGVTEGPHIYKRGGWYYLLLAEGGTFYQHAVSIARSRSLTGPYELSPNHPLLTSDGKPRDLPAEVRPRQSGRDRIRRVVPGPSVWPSPGVAWTGPRGGRGLRHPPLPAGP